MSYSIALTFYLLHEIICAFIYTFFNSNFSYTRVAVRASGGVRADCSCLRVKAGLHPGQGASLSQGLHEITCLFYSNI